MSQKTVEVNKIGSLTLKTVVDHETRETTAEIIKTNDFDEIIIRATGRAKWNPSDHFDPEIGVGIATGRAMARFGKKVTNFWKTMSMSDGEFRAEERRNKRLLQLGSVSLAQIERMESLEKESRKPRKPVKTWFKGKHEECDLIVYHYHTDTGETGLTDKVAPQPSRTLLQAIKDSVVASGTDRYNNVVNNTVVAKGEEPKKGAHI